VHLDLRSYLALFDEVCREKFGQTYRFEKLEKSFAYLREESQWLTVSHLEKLFDSTNTPFERYWPKPDFKTLNATLRDQRLKLAPVGGDPRPLIQRLLAVFHNIGTASLLLRFTYPERFAVFSAPVINLLQIQRARSTDLYIEYCKELGLWREHFRLGSVAETEMSLWAYQQLASDERLTRNVGGALPAGSLADDVWAQRRRAAQVLRPFLENYGSLELARILAEESPKLAAMIAGEEYERRLRAAARRFYPASSPAGSRWAYNLINRMVQDRHVALEDRLRLSEIWDIRNTAMHADDGRGIRLDSVTVEKMIEGIESICKRWLPRSQGITAPVSNDKLTG
jgi:hypothetical protein